MGLHISRHIKKATKSVGHGIKKVTGKVEHGFKKGAGIILPAAAATIGFMVGGPIGAAIGGNIGAQLGGDKIAAREMAKKSSSSYADTDTDTTTSNVDETEIVTPTQNYTTAANTNSDVGFGDVMSIFDDEDEDDPFKALL